MEARRAEEREREKGKNLSEWMREKSGRRDWYRKKRGQVLCHVRMFGFMFIMPAKLSILSVYLTTVATVTTVVSCCNELIFFIGWVAGMCGAIEFFFVVKSWRIAYVCVCVCTRARLPYARNMIYIWNIEERGGGWSFVSFKISISFVNIL